MLLEETIQFSSDGNFDRIVACELAIAQAIKMDPIMGRIGTSDERIKSLYIKRNKPALFAPTRKMFTNRKNKLFV
jgi:hypothetical protein